MDGVNKVTLGVVQFACSDDVAENIATASRLVRQAAAEGANIVVVQELFEGHYFCQEENPAHFDRARPLDGHPTLAAMQSLAAGCGVVIPVSLFERKNQAYYNSLVMVDDRGEALGVYRKSHIPDGPGYHEKFYFNPGDTGFPVWETAYAKVGTLICWDQWFPEPARILALKGAEIICYPTAIGSEPQDPTLQSKDHWQRTMQGHSAANLTPVIASNRIGREVGKNAEITFYGASFITGADGAKLVEAEVPDEMVLTAEIDLEAARRQRLNWGVFRDRRPDLYAELLTLDGQHTHASRK